MTASAFPAYSHFRIPAVRHLAWLCHAPQLLTAASVFQPVEYLPADLSQRLQHWDQHPERGPSVLTAVPHYRLGLYVEQLYECLLRDLLGWQVLARNLPVRDQGVTLGELDFVLKNPHSGAIEHHEVAIKFYLGMAATAKSPQRWYGPNARDRLDIKTERMLNHQSQRRHLPATRVALQEAGVDIPKLSRVFMPGYLFYPVTNEVAAPPEADPQHLRGRWAYADEISARDTRHWIVLRKPHWLGGAVVDMEPDATKVADELAAIKQYGTPRLFAAMDFDQVTGRWLEYERTFVVPASWPAV